MLLLRTFGRLASTEARNQLFTIKDSGLQRLKQILEKPQEEFLRIYVDRGGCSGFSYKLEIERQPIDPKEDLVFERDSYRVVINKLDLPYLKGSAIEYKGDLIKSSFSIENPIAESKCSCGTSFHVDTNKLNKPEQ